MYKTKLSIIFFLFLFSSAFSQGTKKTEVIDIISNINGKEYQLLVSLPSGYGSTDQKYSVIFLLEANYYHRTLMNIYDTLSLANKESCIIVGIAFNPEPIANSDYLRDFLPVQLEKYPNSGYAKEFKEVLEKELIPLCLENYNIEETSISIIGHHFSASFLVWLLSQEHKILANYIICNPILDLYETPLPKISIDEPLKTGIYLSSASKSTAYFKIDLKQNKIRFAKYANATTKLDAEDVKVMIKEHSIDLFYEDLIKGFDEGLRFILKGFNHSNEKSGISSGLKADKGYTFETEKWPDKSTDEIYEISYFQEQNSSNHQLPAMVILDGDFNFISLVNEYRKLRRVEAIPEMLLVGVGYGTIVLGLGNERDRDFLPKKESSNAPNFVKFINEQLISHLSEDFDIDTAKMSITGHSFGGTFLTYLLSQEECKYHNFILTAPNLHSSVISNPKQILPSEINKNVYIASGLLDGNRTDARKLDRAISTKVTGSYKLQLHKAEDHTSEIPVAFYDGLMFLFGTK